MPLNENQRKFSYAGINLIIFDWHPMYLIISNMVVAINENFSLKALTLLFLINTRGTLLNHTWFSRDVYVQGGFILIS